MASVRQTDPSVNLHLLVAAEGPLIESARKLGVNVHLLPLPASLLTAGDYALRGQGRYRAALTMIPRTVPLAWKTWQYARRLKRFVDKIQPNIIHSNSNKFHLLTGLASLRRSCIVWHVRDFLGSRPLMSRVLRWAAGCCPTIIAISQAVEQDIRLVLQSVPTAVIHNAIDTDHFTPGPGDGRRLDRLAGLPEVGADILRVGLVATFARWKGQNVFLEAAEEVLRDVPQLKLRFYIVGSPIYHTHGSQWSVSELKARAPHLLSTQRLGFVSFQEDIVEVYRALDIVVHASTEPEPFGRTIIEAMACAKAVIVARAGGTVELYKHDVDAIGVLPGDVSGLALAIRTLVEDAQRRQRLCKQARLTAVSRFNQSRLGQQILESYRVLLRGGV
ncbi:MAG TPA: glycosyltransferase family 4 protein [Gemmataceae bacterium]|jgi:glycosyltransferase involved in cell wall biosynthesis